jgi:hypothetical protein
MYVGNENLYYIIFLVIYLTQIQNNYAYLVTNYSIEMYT